MKRMILTLTLAAFVFLLCFGATACTVKIKDPSITDDKAELKSVEIKAENTTTHTVNGENAQALFDLVRGFGELDKEALDIGISGYSSVETEYDYTFKISYTAGNFFRKEEGEFTYNVGERVIRTRENGESSVKYTENKLVCINGLVKRTAELSDAQLEKVKSVFESVNGTVMPSAFERANGIFDGENTFGRYYKRCGGGVRLPSSRRGRAYTRGLRDTRGQRGQLSFLYHGRAMGDFRGEVRVVFARRQDMLFLVGARLRRDQEYAHELNL